MSTLVVIDSSGFFSGYIKMNGGKKWISGISSAGIMFSLFAFVLFLLHLLINALICVRPASQMTFLFRALLIP